MIKLLSKWDELQKYQDFRESFLETENSYWLTDDLIKNITNGSRTKRENNPRIKSELSTVDTVMIDGISILTTLNTNLFLGRREDLTYSKTGCVFSPVKIHDMLDSERLETLGDLSFNL